MSWARRRELGARRLLSGPPLPTTDGGEPGPSGWLCGCLHLAVRLLTAAWHRMSPGKRHCEVFPLEDTPVRQGTTDFSDDTAGGVTD